MHIIAANPLILWVTLGREEKVQTSEKKPLRGTGLIRKYPFTGGAEVPTGRQTGHTATRRKTKNKR
jgi:hypothetical protein